MNERVKQKVFENLSCILSVYCFNHFLSFYLSNYLIISMINTNHIIHYKNINILY